MLVYVALASHNRTVPVLPYGIGAIIAILAVFAAWVAKTFLTGLLNRLGFQSADGLVGRIGRVGSLRGGRLRRYRRAVIENLAMHPLGFDGSGAIDIRSRYVPLQYERDGRREDVYARIREEKRSVVTGAAGAGKSLLLKNSVLIWAAGSRDVIQTRNSRRQVPIIVDLHRCNTNDGDIPQLVIEELTRNQVRRAQSFAEKALREGRLRLFLDGLDEVGRERQEHVTSMLRDFARTYPACQIVVTCRDASYYGQLSPEFSHVVRVADFDDASVRRLLRRWPGIERTEVDSLVNTLRGNPPLMRLARSPLLLTMIAYLYVHKFAKTGRTLPASRATFYETAIMHLLGRDRELGRSGSLSVYDVTDKLAVLQRIALTLQEATEEGDDRRAISRKQAISVTRSVLPDINLEEASIKPLLDEIVERSQLLVALDRTGTQYIFRHLTLQEYLAARELADQPTHLMEHYCRDSAAWREIVKLWCGGGIRDCTSVVAEVMGFGELHDQVLALECVAEARHINDAYAAKVISRFMGLLGEPGPESDSIISAFGAVAAAGGPRGREVLASLVEKATSQRNVSASTRRAALFALSASGRSEAAEVLVPLTSTDQDARVALRAMGEFGIPALTKRAWDGDIQAIDDLAFIATPAAAEALAALLWEDERVATRAAWWLAELLVSPDVEDGLRYSAIKAHHNAPVLDWIWRPFAGLEDNTLHAIVGRISYMLDTGAEDVIPESVKEVDVRIALPIAGLAIAEELRDIQRAQLTTRRKTNQTHKLPTDETSGQQANAEKVSREVDLNKVLRNLEGLVRRVGAVENIQLRQEIDWMDVDRVCSAAGQHQIPSRAANLLAEKIMSELDLDKRYRKAVSRLSWPVRANLLGAIGNPHMSKVRRRDWLYVNRRPRPATMLWGLHIGLWVLLLLGTIGLTSYEQVQILRGESSSGLISQIHTGLMGSARHNWLSVMDPRWHSLATLICLGVSVTIVGIELIIVRGSFRYPRILQPVSAAGYLLLIVVAIFSVVITWFTLLALIGELACTAIFAAFATGFVISAWWGSQRSHQVANPLRRCLNAGNQSLHNRVSIIAE